MGRGAIRIGPRGLFAAAAAATAAVALATSPAPAPATEVLSEQQKLTSATTGPGSSGGKVAYNSKNRQWLVVYATAVSGTETEVFAQRLSDLGSPLEGPVQVSSTPAVGFSAGDPVVAYSRKTNSYLVAYRAEGLATDDEVEVFARRLGADGDHAGSQFRVSETGPEGSLDHQVESGPAIAYNGDENQYLVAWGADDTVDGEAEIHVQRIGATGNEIGPEVQASSTPGAGRDASRPSVAYNADTNEYLVAWDDDGFADPDETDVFGQRLNSAAVPVGADDFRISETGADGNPDFFARAPSVAANGDRGEYLVAFTATMPSQELEIAVQRLGADGSQVGLDDQRVTDSGADGSLGPIADFAQASYSEPARQYVVAYAASDGGAFDELEAFAQRLSPDGEELGPNDLRVSVLAPDGNANFGLGSATGVVPIGIGANVQLSEWVVGYSADEAAANDTFNVFSRRIGLSGKCGSKIARVAGPGRDLIRLGNKRDVISAKGGRDNVRGQGGKDKICGGKGKDRLSGGKGRDRLLGQKGKDRCLGGKGRDRAKGCERTGSI